MHLMTADQLDNITENSNWADPALGAKASASSYCEDPPGGYGPENVFGDNVHRGWQANAETVGAWIEIEFNELRSVSELWLLIEPLPTDILGQNAYIMTYSRASLLAVPRKLRINFSSGASYTAELLQKTDYFQIISLPKLERTSSVSIQIEEVWPKPGATETGIGKIRLFSQKHSPAFEITAHTMYDVRDGRGVQAATLNLINPGEALQESKLLISASGTILTTIPLELAPAHASFEQYIWIPAPFEDAEMEFEVISQPAKFCCKRNLQVPAYRCYFDRGTYELSCTNHNDLGWLNTPEKTADYRSSELILPALELMQKYPEFTYSMESTAYLMEFLERHPEKRSEMAARMEEQRFTWGASYVQLLQASVGPEKLVRQFYFGRRWLKSTFPGVDTRFYIQTDPPQMSLQMPQILAKAGIKYCLLGRLPFGFYNWRSPDGSSVLTRGFRYTSRTLLDPEDNSGWLRFAEVRESYYTLRQLPRMFIYDYTCDYLPPQPSLVPYVRHENKSMEEFALIWNVHFAGDKNRSIKPPQILFTTPEKFLDEFTAKPLNLPSLYGDWPLSWAYYDEPSNREALLNGRHAHNDLLAAERLYAGLGLRYGFTDYPTRDFEEAWRANIWPDHGWGGNRGTLTDQVYADSYAKSKTLSDTLLSRLAQKIIPNVAQKSDSQIPVVIYNALSWTRSDVVQLTINLPDHWLGWTLVDGSGKTIPCEFVEDSEERGRFNIVFVAQEMPPLGYRCLFLRSAVARPVASVSLNEKTIESDFFRLTFGPGGVKSLYDKRQQWDVLRTDKFEGGEVLEFTAPGRAWEDVETVGIQNFDRTANHEFGFTSLIKSPVRITALREAHFDNFSLREFFHIYNEVDRVDIEIEILNWKGTKSRELRVAFPINLDEARLSYEVPFGTVEIGKDELDFSLLSLDAYGELAQFSPKYYGGAGALAFREAINWIDASSPNYSSAGCLAASDMTLHVFRDETDQPVSYPVLQHVLLSVRQSLAWNPEYWCTQEGNHRYRMALFPHGGDWRLRYREGIGFNYRLIAFVGQESAGVQGSSVSDTESFLRLEPRNLVLTAMKKSEDDDHIVLRFYEAEGNESVARVSLSVPIRHAWRVSLIEEDGDAIPPLGDGSIELAVSPWEIVTLKVAI
jgi:alpha-mannosidase